VLVNNAGYGLFGPLEGATPEQLARVFQTNVLGLAAVTRHVLPIMRERRTGTIVNVSSIAGRFGSAFMSPYHATKFAVEGLSESLRFELSLHGIRVKLIEPGFFKSDFVTRSLEWTKHSAYEPQLGNMMMWVTRSTGRSADPEEVAAAIFGAATDSSSRLRYPVRGRLFFFIRAILPDALWCRLQGAGMHRRPAK
jgi:NAD(P)-dependent dehydrogenase (short-subunit alcohol dehydrogenase family)